MEHKELVAAVLDKEWQMTLELEGVKENEQQEKLMFETVRGANFDAWSDDMLEAYIADLTEAELNGRNIIREKFVRMIKNSAPEEYERQKQLLTELGEEKQNLIDRIWQKIHIETADFERAYPALSLGGRPLTAEEENDIPSVETYQRCELASCSMRTLELFEQYLASLEAQNESLVRLIQEKTLKAAGFESLDDAEKQITMAAMGQMDKGGCCCCGGD